MNIYQFVHTCICKYIFSLYDIRDALFDIKFKSKTSASPWHPPVQSPSHCYLKYPVASGFKTKSIEYESALSFRQRQSIPPPPLQCASYVLNSGWALLFRRMRWLTGCTARQQQRRSVNINITNLRQRCATLAWRASAPCSPTQTSPAAPLCPGENVSTLFRNHFHGWYNNIS